APPSGVGGGRPRTLGTPRPVGLPRWRPCGWDHRIGPVRRAARLGRHGPFGRWHGPFGRWRRPFGRRQRPDGAEGDDLVGEADAPVRALGHPEFLVQAEQVLLDRRLGDHQVSRYLPGRGRCDERFVGQGGPAQGGEDVELTPGQLRAGGTAKLNLGRQVLLREPADPAACRAETEYVAVLEYPACDKPAVYPCSVA